MRGNTSDAILYLLMQTYKDNFLIILINLHELNLSSWTVFVIIVAVSIGRDARMCDVETM